MRFGELFKEGYEPKHKCKTPDAQYSSNIGKRKVTMSVKTPMDIDLTDEEADDLEAELHYAFEKLLAQLFKKN